MCEVCRPEVPHRSRYYRVLDPCYTQEDDPCEGYWGPSGGFYRVYTGRGRRGCPIHGSHYTRPSVAVGDYREFTPDVRGRFWRLSNPPRDHDLLIPSSMSGQYRNPIHGPSGERIPLTAAPPSKLHRVIGYREPAYIPEFGQSPTPMLKPDILPREPYTQVYSQEEATTPPPPIQSRSSAQHRKLAESGPGWKVFHCTDEQGSHTIVCIGDVVAEMRPQQTVQITETTPETWFSKPGHQGATCLGDQNPNFVNCYLAYSNSVPQTHALIGHFALHVDEAVTVALTKEAPPTAISG